MFARNNISPLTTIKSISVLQRIALLCLGLLMISAGNLSAQVISTNGTVFINNTSGTVIVTGTVESNSGSTVTNNGTIELTGNWTNAGTYSSTSGTVDYKGSGAQNVAGLSYHHLLISTSGTKTLSASAAIAGNLTLSGTATLADGGFQIAGNGTGLLTMAAGNTLTLGSSGTATLFPTNFTNGNITFTAGSTVIYNSDQAQTISGTPTYRNLTLNATSAVTKTLGASATINGNLTVNANNTLADGGFQIVGNASGTFSLTAGTTLTLGNATATILPTFNIYSFNSTSTVNYNSTSNQTISATPTYGHLTLTAASGTPTKSISGTTSILGNLTIGANDTFSVAGGSVLTISLDMILNGNILNSGTINIGL